MDLPRFVPQLDDDSQTWTRFVDKAAKGSFKAAEMLTSAEWSVVARMSGQRLHETAPEATYDAFIGARTLGPLPSVWLPPRRHPREFYDSLWNGRRTVDPHELVDDALDHLRERWSASEYVRLKAAIDDAGLDYNSQDVVAAMLLLLNLDALTPRP